MPVLINVFMLTKDIPQNITAVTMDNVAMKGLLFDIKLLIAFNIENSFY
jgi:hypothetical protein